MTQEEKNQRIMEVLEQEAGEIGEYCLHVWVDYYKDNFDDPEEVDFSMVTLGADCDDAGNVSWAVQDGDNSYTGPVYSFPYWGVIYPHENTVEGYATEIIESVEEALPW